MSGYKMIYSSDMDEEGVVEKFDVIKRANENLFDSIYSEMNGEGLRGIREDVLDYISQNIDEFRSDWDYVFHITALVWDDRMSPEHIKLINSFFGKAAAGTQYTLCEFVIVFTDAVQKGIPLEEISRIFGSGDDITDIQEKIAEWQPKEEHCDSTTVESEVVVDNPDAEYDCENTNGSGYADMLSSIVNVMSYKDSHMDHSAIGIQDNFNKIIAKFQLAVTEISAYSAEVTHAVETDRAENERLRAMLELQQKILNGQQQKINEQKGEIIRLKSIIQDAEKAQMQREEINNKISELQALTYASASQKKIGSDYPYSFQY